MKINNFLRLRSGQVFKLVIAITVSELAGVIGSTALTTGGSLNVWYAGLVKPTLNPPAWVFGPVWTTLYALMGIAFFLVWSSYVKATEGRSNIVHDAEPLCVSLTNDLFMVHLA